MDPGGAIGSWQRPPLPLDTMGKKSRRHATPENAKPKRREVPFVERPFEGLPAETDLVAMREILPSASAELDIDGTPVLFVTLLPDQLPALRREDGTVVVAFQTRMRSGDASRDIAHAYTKALELEPGRPLYLSELPEPGTRLQDLIPAGEPLAVTVHQGFEYWVDPATERTAELEEALEAAAGNAVPMEAVPGVTSAYWTRMGKEFLRWIRPEPEYELLDALARLQSKRQTDLEDGARLIGAFRTCGVLVPVWELNPGTEADELTGPCRAFEERLQEALAVDGPLDADERRARAGLIARQVSLR